MPRRIAFPPRIYSRSIATREFKGILRTPTTLQSLRTANTPCLSQMPPTGPARYSPTVTTKSGSPAFIRQAENQHSCHEPQAANHFLDSHSVPVWLQRAGPDRRLWLPVLPLRVTLECHGCRMTPSRRHACGCPIPFCRNFKASTRIYVVSH